MSLDKYWEQLAEAIKSIDTLHDQRRKAEAERDALSAAVDRWAQDWHLASTEAAAYKAERDALREALNRIRGEWPSEEEIAEVGVGCGCGHEQIAHDALELFDAARNP